MSELFNNYQCFKNTTYLKTKKGILYINLMDTLTKYKYLSLQSNLDCRFIKYIIIHLYHANLTNIFLLTH